MPRSAREMPSPPAVTRTKPKNPKGNEKALILKLPAVKRLTLSYWDLWFSVVAERLFDGDFAALRRELRRLRDAAILDREKYTAKLSHLSDLRRRLERAGLGAADLVKAAMPLTAGEVRRARSKVLEGSDRESEWSEAMIDTPKKRGYARALHGLWPQFPVSPGPYFDEIMSHFKSRGFYGENQSFSVARRFDRYTEKANKLLQKRRPAEAQAMLRAVMSAIVEVLEFADDSFGSIGMSFHEAFLGYMRLSAADTQTDDAVFFADLLNFLVWEDYGLTFEDKLGYFRKLNKEQASWCINYLRWQIDELRGEDLDYQAENALTLLGQIVAEKARFDLYEALASEMGTRHWDRTLRMADAAERRGKRDVALRVLEKALAHPGLHHDTIQTHYEQLKRGKWEPKLRGESRNSHRLRTHRGAKK